MPKVKAGDTQTQMNINRVTLAGFLRQKFYKNSRLFEAFSFNYSKPIQGSSSS